MRNSLAAITCLLLAAAPSFAEDAYDIRAHALYHELRCMVCGGESLAESNAELAIGMRKMILEKLKSGESEQQITSYLTEKYGDEILMSPPLRKDTAFLWLLPLLLFAAGGTGIFFYRIKTRHV